MENNLREEIAKLAYDFHQKRGFAHGSDMQDWLEAEKIVLARSKTGPVKEKATKSPKATIKKRK